MQLDSKQKKLAVIIVLLLVSVILVAALLWRVNSLRTVGVPGTSPNSVDLQPNALTALQNIWPLGGVEESGVYGFLCAVTDLIEENEGRDLTPNLQSIFSVRCNYLASDNTVHTLLIPLAFRLTENGEVSTIIYGYELVPASLQSFEVKALLERNYEFVPGKVIAVSFNVPLENNSFVGGAELLRPEISQTVSKEAINSFIQQGNSAVLGEKFIPLYVHFKDFTGPQRLTR